MPRIHLNEITFRHQSQNFYKILKPIPYPKVQKESERSDEYMVSRRETENVYRDLLQKKYDPDMSFLYATIVGFHAMDPPFEYPGFTFYFKLTEEQLSETIFEVVDKHHILPPKLGKEGLQDSLNFWNKFKNDMHPYEEREVNGLIMPRVEVIISYPIKPFKFIPQIEDR